MSSSVRIRVRGPVERTPPSARTTRPRMSSNEVPRRHGVGQLDDRLFALADHADVDLRRGLQRELGRGGDVLSTRHDRHCREASANHLDQPPDLRPVLREHATDPDEVGLALDSLDDLFAAQADGHHLVVEQRGDLERVLAEAVDDPRLVASLAQARREVSRADRRCQRARIRPGRNKERGTENGNNCHEDRPQEYRRTPFFSTISRAYGINGRRGSAGRCRRGDDRRAGR